MLLNVQLSARFTRYISSLILITSLTGCSVTGFAPDVDGEAVSSIALDVEQVELQETVDPSDWDKVRSVMAISLATQPSGLPVQWENDVTGTIGTIIPMALKPENDGRLCRAFSTTLNGIGGVLQYRGDACKRPDGDIELVGLTPHNAVVDLSSAGLNQKIQ